MNELNCQIPQPVTIAIQSSSCQSKSPVDHRTGDHRVDPSFVLSLHP